MSQNVFFQLKNAIETRDHLGMRILIKKLARSKLDYKQWALVRRHIHNHPRVGFDIVFKWDRIRPKKLGNSKLESQIFSTMTKADELMLQKNFEQAFRLYQKIAKRMKRNVLKTKRENLYLYNIMVHSMARALYGAERYDESLEVYSWITTSYPRYRQILFEKMWAAFLAGKVDLAVGAVASQKSTYFSNYLEPEAYLVLLYIYKKLCKESEIKAVYKELKQWNEDLKDGSFSFDTWAQNDIELLSLYNLMNAKINNTDDSLASEKRSEQVKIENILKARFENEKNRLKKEIEKILAYSFLAIAAEELKMNPGEKLDRSEALKKGREIWPVESAEDWVDEIGGHVFIGDNKCTK